MVPGECKGSRVRRAFGPAHSRGSSITAMNWLSGELDRLLAPAYLEGLQELSIDEVRALRAECEEVEVALSFLRRMAQGRLDIVRALMGPDTTDGAELDELISDLPGIIAGPPRPTSPPRPQKTMDPGTEHEGLTEELDELLDAGRIAALPTMDARDREEIAEALALYESRVSASRHAVHELLARIEAEIVRRYKAGDMSIDGLLS